ncbi:MAG: phosphate ABC transporter permease PstA, partial [Propionibacteriaceae bacterium]|nr:phosphate ABC transporter permease PstA [Propionibacteriaceae bacterium]
GAIHAITGTALITLAAVIISVPIGVGTAIYLVEYGRGAVPKLIRFLTDVMTGIPSIVAGLFAYALIVIFVGPGARAGIAGAIALSLLMIPVVIKSSEEMLILVPEDLREASMALGAPKYKTVTSVVLPTSMSGILAGVMLGVCRIIGETAPLLLVAGFTDSMNRNLFDGRMSTLPVYIYSQWQNKGANSEAYDNRAWTAALVLIAIVLIFNMASRVVAHFLSPKTSKR